MRGPHELRQVKQAMQVALHHQLGKEPLFVLNAFALGPWATGMNVSMSVVDIAIKGSSSTNRITAERFTFCATDGGA